MFMFWSKRTVLTRRLLKAKVRREYETECETQEDTSTTRNNNATSVTSSIAPGASTIYSHNAGGSTTATVTTASTTVISAASPADLQTITNQKQNKRSGNTTISGGNSSNNKTSTSSSNNTNNPIGNSGTSENNSKSGRGCAKLHHACCAGADSQDDRDDDDDNDNNYNEDNEINCNNIDNSNILSNKRLASCKELLKSLKENQLDMLLTTIESYGVDLGSCVLVAKKSFNSRQDNNINNDQQDHYRRHRHSSRSIRHYHHHLRHRHTNHFNRHRSRCRHCELRHGDENDIIDETTNHIEERRLSINNDNITSSRAMCVTIPPAHLLSCQMWRWPDLKHSSELKKLPVCHSSKDPSYVCCNPYHWSRLCKPESPPPPYCLIPAERSAMNREDPSCAIQLSQADSQRCGNAAAPSRLPESLTTDGEDRNNSNRKEWCTLAYWELGGRVGRLYPVEASTISVFDSIHDGDGLCLASLAENHGSSAAVRRTRSKIGLGLMLSQEDDGVWAYNRSACPIFVNSPTLDDPESRTLLVYRVPPGFCLNIFDRAKCPLSRFTYGESPSTGPVDANSVRISFAKGWGPKYSRQEITSCPCWLEVLLAPCR
ncbi:hypothetical protein PV327_000830 [Microctonus hyperodae]|uniref:Mothers against decapentaplegic homolog n=1 Tax=Microctonus hyperodae TaxID=165561 RepID=A0AA39L2C2_MICHY|nr:hypothetical protein PV327_000830 [Microctonus hyperodae]